MKTRLLLTLTALLLALSAWANGTEINGIYYVLDSDTKTASVTYTGNYSSYNFNPSSTANTGSITIPATVTYGGTTYSVTSIGNEAFCYCSGLTSITIPNSVTSIGNYAFKFCKGLTSITIPSSVTSIGDYAFAVCEGLTSITIPNSVTSIGDLAFYECTDLTSIKVAADNTKYDSRDNCNGIIETASNTLVVGCKATIIPNSVTGIGGDAFYGCTGLTSITIPNSVTSIGGYAFEGCTGLTSITIPNSVTSIGYHAFARCTGLTSITALRTDPEAYNCYQDAFKNVPTSTCTLHVPKGSKEAYKAIKPWSNFANIVEEEDLTAIQSLTLTPSEAGESYYTLQGQRIAQPQSGIVIVRYSDGSSRKMYVR